MSFSLKPFMEKGPISSCDNFMFDLERCQTTKTTKIWQFPYLLIWYPENPKRLALSSLHCYYWVRVTPRCMSLLIIYSEQEIISRSKRRRCLSFLRVNSLHCMGECSNKSMATCNDFICNVHFGILWIFIATDFNERIAVATALTVHQVD